MLGMCLMCVQGVFFQLLLVGPANPFISWALSWRPCLGYNTSYGLWCMLNWSIKMFLSFCNRTKQKMFCR